MPRKGENIYKRKDGRWEGRYIKKYSNQGKVEFGYVYAKTYKEVKEKLMRAKCEPQIEHSAKSIAPIYFGELIDQWITYTSINTKESTLARYCGLLDRHVRNEFGSIPVDIITTEFIEQYITQLLVSGRLDGRGGLAPKTVSDILSVIKSIFAYSARHGIHVNCNPSSIAVKNPKRQLRVLSKEEQSILVTYLQENTDLNKLGVLICLYTGIRVGELCAMKWGKIDFATNTMQVDCTLQRVETRAGQGIHKTNIVISRPKSECSERVIPIPSCLISCLKYHYRKSDDYILTGEANRFVEPRVMQYRFKKMLKDCDIQPAPFHALRHTFATRCVEIGFEIKSLSEILGHSNVNITLNRYVHSSFVLKQQNMDKLTLSN